MPVRFCIVSGCFCSPTAEMNSWDTTSMALKAPDIYYLALCRRRSLTPSLAQETWAAVQCLWSTGINCATRGYTGTHTHCTNSLVPLFLPFPKFRDHDRVRVGRRVRGGCGKWLWPARRAELVCCPHHTLGPRSGPGGRAVGTLAERVSLRHVPGMPVGYSPPEHGNLCHTCVCRNRTCVPKNQEGAVCVCSMLTDDVVSADIYQLDLWAGKQRLWGGSFQPSKHGECGRLELARVGGGVVPEPQPGSGAGEADSSWGNEV